MNFTELALACVVVTVAVTVCGVFVVLRLRVVVWRMGRLVKEAGRPSAARNLCLCLFAF